MRLLIFFSLIATALYLSVTLANGQGHRTYYGHGDDWKLQKGLDHKTKPLSKKEMDEYMNKSDIFRKWREEREGAEKARKEKIQQKQLEEEQQESLKLRAREKAARKSRVAAFTQEEKKMMAGVMTARKAGKFSQVVSLLKKMSAKGHPKGAYLLGKMYLDGDGVKADTKKAFTWFYTAARGGSGQGSYALASAYMNGTGVEKDMNKAISWLKVSSAPIAKSLLGALYMEGIGVGKNYDEAWSQFKKSNEPAARASMGEICYLGLGIPKRFIEAKRWFDDAAQSGNPKALFYLSKMYANGDGVKKSETKASEYASRYQKCMAVFPKPENTEQELLTKGLADMDARMARLGKDSTPEKPRVAKRKSPEKKIARKKAPYAYKPPSKSRSEVYTEVEQLVKKFYPRAKINSTDNSLHFEFKARSSRTVGRREIRIPKLDGIVGDIKVTAGKYPGKEYLPCQTHGTLFSSVLMAPYSTSDDKHLLTKLKYPPNAPLDFVKQFKNVVSMYSR